MKRRIKSIPVLLLLILIGSLLMSCKKNSKLVDNTQVSNSPESIQPTDKEEIQAVDLTALEEELTGVSLDIQERRHYVYSGNFGEEAVLVSIWLDRENEEAIVSVVGDFHSDLLHYDCEILEDGLRFRNDKVFLVLKEHKDSTFSGYYCEFGNDVADIFLALMYINEGTDKDSMYSMGENKEVEEFAQKVIDAVNTNDQPLFVSLIEFPVAMNIDGVRRTIHDKQEFLEIPSESVFTEGLQASMMQVYPNFLMEDKNDGIMVGSSNFHVWIKNTENNSLKVVSIDN